MNNSVLFDIYYENYAWGYNHHGKLILNNGEVRSYNMGHEKQPLIEDKLKNSTLIEELSLDMMNKLKNSITNIKKEESIKKRTRYDGGNIFYYLYDRNNEKILLFKRGDENYSNSTISLSVKNTIDLLKILNIVYTSDNKCKMCPTLNSNKIDFALGKLFCTSECKDKYYDIKKYNTSTNINIVNKILEKRKNKEYKPLNKKMKLTGIIINNNNNNKVDKIEKKSDIVLSLDTKLNDKLWKYLPLFSVISPFSIEFALLLLYMGTNNESKKIMENVLTLRVNNENNQDIKDLVINYMNNINNYIKGDKTVQIFNSSIILIKDEYKINGEYKGNFIGEICNFTTLIDAVNKSNDWCDKNTNHLIKECLKEDDLTLDTIFIIINSIYFNAKWLNRFKASSTHSRIFTKNDNTTVEALFMHQTSYFDYYEDTDNQYLKLNYGIIDKEYNHITSDYCMIIKLPIHKKKDIFNYTDLKLILPFLKENVRIKLYLPKFEQRFKMVLNDIIKKIGLSHLFDKNKAGINKIIENLENNIYISKIIHQVVFKVDEEGTEAAAVTVIVGETESIPIKEKNILFDTNKPFQYSIINTKHQFVLFDGIYNGE